MQQRKHIIAAGMFLVVLAGLGGAEAYVLRDKLRGALLLGQPITTAGDIATPTLNIDGVERKEGTPVDELLARHAQFDIRPAKTSMFLTVLFPDESVEARDIFTHDEYAGTIAWVESPDVKDEFLSLKDALLPAFSPQLSALVDTTVRAPGAPTRNVLSFYDPALNPNHLSFVRVRNRLFETHAPQGMETAMEGLLNDLVAD